VSALGNHRGLPLRGNWALLIAIFNTLLKPKGICLKRIYSIIGKGSLRLSRFGMTLAVLDLK
jgi:hypothetical protein